MLLPWEKIVFSVGKGNQVLNENMQAPVNFVSPRRSPVRLHRSLARLRRGPMRLQRSLTFVAVDYQEFLRTVIRPSLGAT